MASREQFWDRVEGQIGWICKQVRRMGVPDRDVSDVSQDVLVELYKTWEQYDESRPLRAWMFGFVFRITSAYRRRAEHRLVTVTGDPAPPPDCQSAQLRLEEREELELVQAALQSIPEGRREVFLMARIEELPIPEVAAVLEIPLNTAYTRLRTANQEFADAVKRLRLRQRAS